MWVYEVAEQRELPSVYQETRTDTGRLAPMPLQDRRCVESEIPSRALLAITAQAPASQAAAGFVRREVTLHPVAAG